MAKRFGPPANNDDFARSEHHSEELKEAWDQRIGGVVRRLVGETAGPSGVPAYPRFYNPLEIPENVQPIPRAISWSGFPRFIETWLNLGDNSVARDYLPAFRAAEQLRAICVAQVHYMRNGTLVDRGQQFFDAQPGTVLQMFPIENNAVVFERGFALEERVQDEYLEWHVSREGGKITKMTFTAEGPEYWDTLARVDPKLLVELYREHVDERVQQDQLYWSQSLAGPIIEFDLDTREQRHVGWTRFSDFAEGSYNPYNIWNTRLGCMHLIQRNNSLGAELRLAADATRRYAARPEATTNVDRFDLCACAGYGAINRNSDPTIGYEVNNLALQGLAVTVSDPIGLYIGEIQLEGLKGPDDQVLTADQVLKITRGDANPAKPRILRFTLTPPEGADFGLESCSLGIHRLNFGGPVAIQTSIVIHGEAIAGSTENPVLGCDGRACAHPTRPNYRVTVGANQTCDAIDWSDVRPPIPIDAPEIATLEVGPEAAEGNDRRGLPMRGLR